MVVESEKTPLMCACLQVFGALNGAQTYGQRVGANRERLKALGLGRAWYWPDRERVIFRSVGIVLNVGDVSQL